MALSRICGFCFQPTRECACDVETPATTPPPFDCRTCQDTGHVCENHPSRPWGRLCCNGPAEPASGGEALSEHGACHCGGAGEPCAACCPPVPTDGSRLIMDAFKPDGKRM